MKRTPLRRKTPLRRTGFKPVWIERQPLPIPKQLRSLYSANPFSKRASTKVGYRLPKASPKRSKQRREYERLRDPFLKQHPRCSACGEQPTELHHYRGRIGRLLCDVRFWIALCPDCHSGVHERPAAARAAGLLAPAHEWNVYPPLGIPMPRPMPRQLPPEPTPTEEHQ